MSTLTENLGLFKYDTSTDGSMPFNINQALNNNWDIIDSAISNGSLSATCSLSENGFIKFNNGLIINYGNAITGSQTASFVQPTLSANGTLGEEEFAVATTNQYLQQAYYGFDDNDNTVFGSSSGDLFIYSSIPLKIQELQFINFHSNHSYDIRGGSIYGSNTNENWSLITTFTQATEGDRVPYTLTVNSPNEYKYYKIQGTTFVEGKYWTFYQCYITATYTTTALNQITFPQAFTSTNYAYSLAYRNGTFGNSYAINLTSTGMTLQNNSKADAVYYIAIGC